jgi:hypothetical protein
MEWLREVQRIREIARDVAARATAVTAIPVPDIRRFNSQGG